MNEETKMDNLVAWNVKNRKDTRIYTRSYDRGYSCMKWNDGKKKDTIIPRCFILEKTNETIWIHTRYFTV